MLWTRCGPGSKLLREGKARASGGDLRSRTRDQGVLGSPTWALKSLKVMTEEMLSKGTASDTGSKRCRWCNTGRWVLGAVV